MSKAVWKMTQLASRELNLIIFSCSAGSLTPSTPPLPNRSHEGESVVGLDLVGHRRDPLAQRRVREIAKQRDGTHRRPTSRNAL